MSEPDLRRFRERSLSDYARDGVRVGRWSEADSLERSRAELDGRLPKGIATPDHSLCRLHDPVARVDVGTLWYARRPAGDGVELFVYRIGIDEAHRRRGYATAALEALEREARRLGATRISRYVFGSNAAARALYEKVGFRPLSRLLARPVEPR